MDNFMLIEQWHRQWWWDEIGHKNTMRHKHTLLGKAAQIASRHLHENGLQKKTVRRFAQTTIIDLVWEMCKMKQ